MSQDADESGRTAAPPPDPSVPPAEAAARQVADTDPVAALERERWLRERFAREHQVMLAMMRLLTSGVGGESRAMRLWRWLIDDIRSQRRLIDSLNGEAGESRSPLDVILSWLAGLRRAGTSGAGRMGRQR